MANNDLPDNVIPLGTTGKPKAGRRKVKAGDPLTAKQMKFAEGLAAGLHFEAAFREAYDCTNYNANTAYKKSFAAQHHPAIKAKVLELRAQAQKLLDAKLTGKSEPSNLPQVIHDSVNAKVNQANEVLITRQTLTRMALEDRQLAQTLGQASAAVASLKFLGTLHQLTTDNREANKVSELEQMTPQQLREFIQSEIQKVGLLIETDDGLLELIDMRPLTTTKQ